MPVGIIMNGLAIAVGGVLGTLFGDKLSDNFKHNMELVFAVCSICMGISAVVLMENMPAVIFAVILGSMIGLGVHLGDRFNQAAMWMQTIISKFIKSEKMPVPEEEFKATLVTVIVLFCASGTGIYGSIVSGMSGDHSILIAKSILDIFTAMIFACVLGSVVSLVAIPQFLIFMCLYILAGVIFPMTTPAMINDFKACGGFIMLATGLRIAKLKLFPTADMIPAMILVMPFSWLWATYIVPML